MLLRGSSNKAIFGLDTDKESGQSNGRVDFEEPALLSTTYTFDPDGPAPEYGGMVYGYSQRYHRYYISRPEAHTILAAPPGTGKTSEHIIPAMMGFIASRSSSVVCVDPQCEIYAATSDYAREQGCEVYRFDYRSTEASDLYSALAELHRRYEEGVEAWRAEIELAAAAAESGDEAAALMHARSADNVLKRAEGDVDSLARDAAAVMIPKRPSDGESSFWKETGQGLLAAVSLLVATYKPGDWAADSPAPAEPYPEQRTLESVLWIIKELGAEVKEKQGNTVISYTPLQIVFDSLRQSHPAVAAFSTVKISKGQTLSGICSTVANALSGIIDVDTNTIGYGSDIDFERIATHKSVVYIIPPGEKPARGAYAAVFLTQMYQALVAYALRLDGTLPMKVQVVFEEFGNMQFPIVGLDAMMGECRKYGMNFHLCVQDFGQLDKWYEPAVSANILRLANVKILLKTNDSKTARDLAERIGKHSIKEAEYGGSQSTLAMVEANVSTRNRSVQTDYLSQADILSWNPEWGTLVWRDLLEKRQSPLARFLHKRDKVEVACYPSVKPKHQPALRVLGAYPMRRLAEKKASAARESKLAARIITTPWTAQAGERARQSPVTLMTETALAESRARRLGSSAASCSYTAKWVAAAASMVLESPAGERTAAVEQLIDDLKEKSKQETAAANRVVMSAEKSLGLGSPYSCTDEGFRTMRSCVGRAWLDEARRLLESEIGDPRGAPSEARAEISTDEPERKTRTCQS